jgi:hypothetical protein
MHFLILRRIVRHDGWSASRRALTGFNAVTYKPASVGAKASRQQAGGIFRALLFDKFIFEKGFAGGGLWVWFGAFAVSWILDLVVVGACDVE